MSTQAKTTQPRLATTRFRNDRTKDVFRAARETSAARRTIVRLSQVGRTRHQRSCRRHRSAKARREGRSDFRQQRRRRRFVVGIAVRRVLHCTGSVAAAVAAAVAAVVCVVVARVDLFDKLRWRTRRHCGRKETTVTNASRKGRKSKFTVEFGVGLGALCLGDVGKLALVGCSSWRARAVQLAQRHAQHAPSVARRAAESWPARSSTPVAR
jgi:hypothetical protein